nr:ABC transporter substrate-binding protein [uncultured Cohaesibacter sp.]
MKSIRKTAQRIAPLMLSVGILCATPSMGFAKDLLTIDLVNEPATLDPHKQWNPDSYYVYRNIFDNIVTRDDDGTIVPQIAASWTQLSDTEIEFVIRDDVVFHDGVKLTPEDVVYSVKRITDPAFASPQLGQFNKIIKAEVVGDNKVKLTTDGPYPALLAQLVKLSVVPEHVASKMSSEEFNANPVGSGPYKFIKWDRGVEVDLGRNDAYWGKKGEFETVTFKGVPDASTRIANLKAGTADLVVTLNSDQAQQLQSSGRGVVKSVTTERVAYFALNSSKSPLDKLEMRKAIGYAIDREGIVEGLLGGYPKVVNELLSPAHFGYSEGIPGFEYDPAKAKEIVAGLGDEAKTEMVLSTAPVYDQRVVQAIQQMLTDVGMNVKIESTDMATWLKGQQSKNDVAPMLAFSRWSCACQDADGIMYPLLHSSSSWSRFNDPKMDELLDAARSEMNVDKRAELYAVANKLAFEKVAVLPLYQAAIIYGASDKLKWRPTPNESMFINRMGWAD